jgi:acetyltransferase-like isoleucine patch superfamily enzyme
MVFIRIASSLLILLFEFAIYFLSLIGPVLWLSSHWNVSAPLLLAMVMLGFLWAGLTFLVLLVIMKRLFFPRIPTGHVAARSKDAALWFYAVSLISIFERSPFRPFAEVGVMGPLFYSGMGGRIPVSTAIGMHAILFEPWFVQMGENVGIGAQAIITGHVAVGEEVFLGNVVIGDNVLIGARSLIFPEVRIGNNARVGAGALVTRGTVIPDGETWVGVPARPLKKKS